jgi:hypothetical protein
VYGQRFGEFRFLQSGLFLPTLLEPALQPGALFLRGADELALAALGIEPGADLPVPLIVLR